IARPFSGGPSMSRSRRRGITAVTVAALFAFVLPATTASAAPPGNDEAARARVITSIPSRLTVDTTDATRHRSTAVGCVGGHGVLRLYRPHPLSLSAPIRRARAGDVSGRALFSGTVRCTNPAVWRLGLAVSQRVGASVARGTGTVVQACGRTTKPWGIVVDSV